jgi:hypothetical protein
MRNFIFLALAVFYTTYVLTRSALPPVKWAREKIIDGFGEGTSPAYLVTCPWCCGFWVAVLLVGFTATFWDVPLPLLVIPACAAVTGVLQLTADLIERVDEFLVLKAEPPNE